MTPTECLKIYAAVHGLCPAMRTDEFTPDLWEKSLAHLTFADAEAAVIRLSQRLRFIGTADICTEVEAMHGGRLEKFVDPVPDADPDDPIAYIRALRAGRFRAATGELPARPVRQALATVGRAIPPPERRKAIAPAPRRLEDLPRWAAFTCPRCGAEPGDLCVVPGTVPVAKREDPHAARRHLAFPPPDGAEP